MRTITTLLALLLAAVLPAARAQTNPAPYPTMAPLDQYLMPQAAEIALARSAAPPSVSDAAEIMVLGRNGYTTAVHGTNGFLCIVERSWADPTNASEFWNPKARSPNCFNRAAARTFVPIYFMKTKLVLAGESPSQILHATDSAFASHQLPALATGAMCYMMSEQQYLNDQGKAWHPHVMFFVAGDVAATWGANQPGSPIIAVDDPEERVTIFMVVVGHWSDGSAAPPLPR
ncbi:MAG: hypothetical protein WBW84_13730 [Acidobacteriaceae bacterium]